MKIKEYAYKKHLGSTLIRLIVFTGAAICAALVLFLVLYIIIRGTPNLTPSMLEWEYTSENVSMMPAILNTLQMTLLTLGISVPIGIFSAIYMTEYARRGSRLVSIIRMTCQTLQGIPSIVYGLFGYILFVLTFGWQYSMIAGALTLSVMVLPLIIRTTEEALMTVPDSYREGSLGLGAGKLRTVIRVVLPNAMLGIFAGVVLSIGRVVGESAALIYTSGTGTSFTGRLTSSARTLSVHMYCLYSEGFYTEQAYATAFVLLIIVVGINTLSMILAKRLAKNKGRE